MTRKKDIAYEARLVRRRRLEVLAQLESGAVDILDLLEQPPAELKGADLWDVLVKVPGLGRQGVRGTCERAAVWPHLTVGTLLPEEIKRLYESLPDRVK